MNSFGSVSYKTIPAGTKFKSIMDINDIPDDLKELISLIDLIFQTNEENYTEIYEKCDKYNKNFYYIFNAIVYAMNVRIKQRKYLLELLALFSKKHNCGKYISHGYNTMDVSTMLYRKGIKNDNGGYPDNRTLNEVLSFFPEGTIEAAIYDDDLEKFISFIGGSDIIPMNMKNTNKIKEFKMFERYDCISYLQLMALLGSIKCFKYALKDGRFPLNDIEKFAIAGGNKEIINLLVNNNIMFNNCFEVSVNYHRDSLSQWLIDRYICEMITLKSTIIAFNDRVFFFLLKNKYYNNDDMYDALVGTAFMGNLQLAIYLVNTLKLDLNHTSNQGVTPLLIAAEMGNIEYAEYLIKHYTVKVNFVDDSLHTPLAYAARNGDLEMCKLLVNEGKANVEMQCKHKQTVIYYAIQFNYFDIFKFFVEECHAKVNKKDKIGMSPLDVATEAENYEITKYLIEECHFRSPEILQSDICSAIQNNKNDFAKYSIEKSKIGIDEKNESGLTFLHIAMMNNNLEMIKYLLEKYSANMLIKTPNDFTDKTYACKSSFEIAVLNNSPQVIEYLKSSKIMIDDKLFINSFATYIINEDYESVNYILENVPLDFTKVWISNEIFRNSELNMIKFFINKYPNIIDRFNEESNLNIIEAAINFSNKGLVQYLIEECNYDANTKYKLGLTPFQYAIQQKKVIIVVYFIKECHCNVFEKDKSGRNALHIATSVPSNDIIIHYLIDNFTFDIDEKDLKELTPIKNLLQNKYDFALIKPIIAMSKDDSLLLWAIDNKNDSLAKLLINESSDFLTKRDQNQRTPLHSAIRQRRFTLARYILEKCPQLVNEKDSSGKTALHYSLENHSDSDAIKSIKLLVQTFHANVEEKDNQGFTILHYAVRYQKKGAVDFLIESCSANKNAPSNDLRRPIHLAIDNGNLMMVKQLAAIHKVDLTVKDINGNTLQKYALLKNQVGIAYYFDPANSNQPPYQNMYQYPYQNIYQNGYRF